MQLPELDYQSLLWVGGLGATLWAGWKARTKLLNVTLLGGDPKNTAFENLHWDGPFEKVCSLLESISHEHRKTNECLNRMAEVQSDSQDLMARIERKLRTRR